MPVFTDNKGCRVELEIKNPLGAETQAVFLAQNTQNKKLVVIKRLPCVSSREGSLAMKITGFKYQFLASSLGVLTGKVGTTTERWLLMPFFQHGDLVEYINTRGGEVPLSICMQIWKQVAIALQALHEKGCLHRDVKLENIYVFRFEDGEIHVVLGDFGGATDEEKVPEDGEHLGTGDFLPPVRNFNPMKDTWEEKHDIFGLSMVMLALFTNHPIHDTDLGCRYYFNGIYRSHIKKSAKEFFTALSTTFEEKQKMNLGEIKPGIQEILFKMLNLDGGAYTASQIIADLEELESDP